MILKFFLNVSKEEQRERFLDRLDEPAKNWKFSMADVAERALWPRYQAAYQDMIRHTSTKEAPWFVVPADHKWFARVVIGSVIVSTLESLNLRFPRVDKASLEEFATGAQGAGERRQGQGPARRPRRKSKPSGSWIRPLDQPAEQVQHADDQRRRADRGAEIGDIEQGGALLLIEFCDRFTHCPSPFSHNGERRPRFP